MILFLQRFLTKIVYFCAMLKSMTGFGKATKEFDTKIVSVEIRSLNSKNLDLNLRLSSTYRDKEHELKSELNKLLERGKVDLSVYVENKTEETPVETTDDTAVAEQSADQAVDDPAEGEAVDISIPGGEGIIVRGSRVRNVEKSAPQVVSVLSSADIARTGEGDIAGALQRVTGLSVVGGGFVYVRGLGDRYSLALLNGSP